MNVLHNPIVNVNIASRICLKHSLSSAAKFSVSKRESISKINFSSSRRHEIRALNIDTENSDDEDRFLTQEELMAASQSALTSSVGKPSDIVPSSSSSSFSSFDEAPEDKTAVQNFLFPNKEDLPDDVEMSIWDHFEELRERAVLGAIVASVAVLTCFVFSKDLVVLLEAPVVKNGVRFLQLSPGEYFFTTLKVAGYTGLLVAAPCVLYEVAAFVIPGLTKSERQFLGPIILGSSVLFYTGIFFSYEILTPAALNFFVTYAEGAVESLWSIDQYFEFVLVLMLSTGLSFQVPVIQLLLGSTGIVSSQQMLDVWRYVVVGAVVAAAVLTPSTDPFTQMLLAGPLIGLYMGGALAVKAVEGNREVETGALP
eukprot:CAMPEP_0196579432 /NCGR_PEP_ID=MMETSP1081-20130531/21994_1 /TAXON_ID=36882 /ORGANISM="Pyramimonas amylifera, Strain CCMP720" /LENGTH=368 /DNA_ID=CAMNT_0041899025 /DNA_START=123 /DNA_END=1229 /DNA_ORIENTATION=+